MVSSKHKFGHVASLLQNPTLPTRTAWTTSPCLLFYLNALSPPDPPELQPHWPQLSASCTCSAPAAPSAAVHVQPRSQLTRYRPPPSLSDANFLTPGSDSSSVYPSFTSLTRGLPRTTLTLRIESLCGETDSQSNTAQSRFSLYIFTTHLHNCTTAPWKQDNTHYYFRQKQNSTHPQERRSTFFF